MKNECVTNSSDSQCYGQLHFYTKSSLSLSLSSSSSSLSEDKAKSRTKSGDVFPRIDWHLVPTCYQFRLLRYSSSTEARFNSILGRPYELVIPEAGCFTVVPISPWYVGTTYFDAMFFKSTFPHNDSLFVIAMTWNYTYLGACLSCRLEGYEVMALWVVIVSFQWDIVATYRGSDLIVKN